MQPATGVHLGPTDPDPATLVRLHQAWVWRYLRFLGADPALADDLAQETFVAVLRAPSRPRDPAALRSYLRKAALSAFSKARKRSRRVELVDPRTADVAFARFCGADDGAAFLDAVRECVAALPDRGRAIIDLRYRDGVSRRDAARLLELTEDGAKALIRRTFARLRACVERRLR